MLPYIIALSIFLTIVHVYIQNFLIPARLFSKIYVVEDFMVRLKSLRSTKTISEDQYQIVNKVFFNTNILLLSDKFNSVFTLERLPKDAKDQFQQDEFKVKLGINNNIEYNKMLDEYIELMKSLYLTSSIGFFIYFMPLFYLFKWKGYFEKKLNIKKTDFLSRIYNFKFSDNAYSHVL